MSYLGTYSDSYPAFNSGATPTPTPVALKVGLAIAVASIVAGNALAFTVSASGGTTPYAYNVIATNTATGNSISIGSAATGSWTPTTAGDYEITATVTDATNTAKISPVRAVRVTAAQATNQVPVANAGDDLTITLPTASVVLQGTANDPDPGDSLNYVWRLVTGPNTPTGLPATSLNVVVSNLAQGIYQFGFQATDSRGGKSGEDFVVVTVQAATPVNTTKIYWAAIGNSIDTPGGSDTADPVYIDSAYQQLGSPANLDLHHYGYPGKTLQWIVDNRLPAILAEIKAARDSGQYAKCVVTLHEGENGLFVYDADTAYNLAVNVSGQLKALATGSFPVQVGPVPVVNRVSGAGLPSDYNGRRTTYNNRLRSNWSTFADFFVEPTNQLSLWGDDYPLNYPNTYCSDGTHPTTEGARIMGVELAQAMRAFVGVATITPAYVKNIGYTAPGTGTPVEQVSPESRTYTFAQMGGPGTLPAADYSNVQQVAYNAGDFSASAVGTKVGQIVNGQRWVADFEFTLLNSGLQHVIGLIQITTVGNDGDIEVRAYAEPNGHFRIWVNRPIGPDLVYDAYPGVADGDKILFRIYTDSFEITKNGANLIKSDGSAFQPIIRATGDIRYFHPAIAFGNANPGDTIAVRQRGLQLVTG